MSVVSLSWQKDCLGDINSSRPGVSPALFSAVEYTRYGDRGFLNWIAEKDMTATVSHWASSLHRARLPEDPFSDRTISPVSSATGIESPGETFAALRMRPAQRGPTHRFRHARIGR